MLIATAWASLGLVAAEAADLDIPYQKTVLANGLTLIVHEDRSAPLVATALWYHVGSKNEPAGKTGFAHLFEHLMFNGSEHFDDDFFKATQRIGATEQNGATGPDRTHYFQTVPKAALDTILWLESDRMGHMLGALDQAKLDEQRAVVKNEKRQRVDNAPYGRARERIVRGTTPPGHPYDHLPIGSMEDLDAATLEDVHQWFKTYYGPNNAVLVLAGDVSMAEARAKVEKYFGDIAPGPPMTRPGSWVIQRSGTVRETMQDRVAQPRLFRVWNVPEYGSADADALQLLGEILAGDKSSRLHKRLVLEERLATEVSVDVYDGEIAGQFTIDVLATPGADLARVETVLQDELARLMAAGPTAAELQRVRTRSIASLTRSLEHLWRRASLLAEGETYLNRPDAWRQAHARLLGAKADELRRVARRWLSGGDYVLRVEPFGSLSASAGGADRSTMPLPDKIELGSFPQVQRTTLANGMKLIVAQRDALPIVNITAVFDTGHAADFATIPAGLGDFALDALDEATKSRSRDQLVAQLGRLGAELSSEGGAEIGLVSLSALLSELRPSLQIFADVVRNPAFASEDIERLREQKLASIGAATQDATKVTARVLPALIHGEQSPQGRVVTAADIRAIHRDDLIAFHERWFRPNNATLIVTGNTRLEAIRPLIEAAFAQWPAAPIPELLVPTAPSLAKARVYLIDRPGAAQSVIRAALPAPPYRESDDIALEAMNVVIGGSFTSRLNMKLREEKGWTYSTRSSLGTGRGPRIFTAGASVQSDKTAESLVEIDTLLRDIVARRQIEPAELAAAKNSMALGLTSAWSTNQGVASYLIQQVVRGLTPDYYRSYPKNITALSLEAVQSQARQLLAGRPITWLIVGDLSRMEQDIRALQLGEVSVIDGDARRIR